MHSPICTPKPNGTRKFPGVFLHIDTSNLQDSRRVTLLPITWLKHGFTLSRLPTAIWVYLRPFSEFPLLSKPSRFVCGRQRGKHKLPLTTANGLNYSQMWFLDEKKLKSLFFLFFFFFPECTEMSRGLLCFLSPHSISPDGTCSLTLHYLQILIPAHDQVSRATCLAQPPLITPPFPSLGNWDVPEGH